jgi:hypothetical protein
MKQDATNCKKTYIIHNDQVVGDTFDPKTLDPFHDCGQPILKCYRDIHDIMVTNTQVTILMTYTTHLLV